MKFYKLIIIIIIIINLKAFKLIIYNNNYKPNLF